MSKINILYISPDFNYACGVSRNVYSLINAFSQRSDYKVYFMTNGGDALDKLKKINIEPEILKFSKGLVNILYIKPNFNSIIKFCINNGIDIIHSHHRYPELIAYYVAKKIEIKTITTVHSIIKGKKFLSFKSDKFIAVSNVVKSMLVNTYKISEKKIITLYNCLEIPKINTNSSELKRTLNIPEDAKILLFLGRITKIKGVDLLIEAVKRIRIQNHNVFLLILGEYYDNTINRYLKGVPAEIKVLSSVEDPFPYYAIADLVILPSKIESFPYVMLESGLMKKPFIGARTGGIEEFIEDDINGLLFECENVQALVEKINYILNNPQKAKMMADNLHAKVIENTSCEKYFSKLSHIYEDLLLKK